MSNPNRPLDARTWTEILSAVIAILLIIGIVTQLRETAPTDELDLIVDGAQDPSLVDQDDVSCARRLPGVTDVRGRLPEPDGRVSSTQVTVCPDLYDQRQVTFVGEVIGDVLQRDGGAWLLVNDDDYALSSGPLPAHREMSGSNTGLAVWLPERFIDLIDAPGGPGVRGTVLELHGTIHRADPHDGGGLTLRADRASVVEESARIPEALHTGQLIVALLAAAAAVAAVVVERRVARTR